MFTVKQLARMAGITPRALHYYDEIGLLKPTRVGDNGYRYYGEEAMLRLQQIMLYRELDIPLEQIKEIMGRRGFDVLEALETHRAVGESHRASGARDSHRGQYDFVSERTTNYEQPPVV